MNLHGKGLLLSLITGVCLCFGILSSCKKNEINDKAPMKNKLKASAQNAQTSTLATNNKIRDMVLIYGGGTEKGQDWDFYSFHPYVVYKTDQQVYEWMFDGFLFLELSDDWNYSFTLGHGDPNKPAQKANWATLIDKYFETGRSLHELDQAIDDATWSAGQPPSKRKIVIGIPEPLTAVANNWGMAEGIWLNFQNPSHKTMACKWFIDEVRARFSSAAFRHLTLDGFYWIGESVEDNASTISAIGTYLSGYNLSFNWIPWWQSPGYTNPGALGFSDTYLQPNYFFYNVPVSRLQDACNAANTYGLGLEMEFDDNVLYFDPYRTKFNQYFDVFGQNNVFDTKKLTYYQSENTILKLWSSTDPLHKVMYKRLSETVTRRQKLGIPTL